MMQERRKRNRCRVASRRVIERSRKKGRRRGKVINYQPLNHLNPKPPLFHKLPQNPPAPLIPLPPSPIPITPTALPSKPKHPIAKTPHKNRTQRTSQTFPTKRTCITEYDKLEDEKA